MSRGLFVTSSGTGIGKTYVTELLCRQLRAARQFVHAIKPIVAGVDDGNIGQSDTGRILNALGVEISPATVSEISPWRFKAALSPDMAARREDRAVPYDEVVRFCRAALGRAEDVTLIEGVGGIMAPVSQMKLNMDLIADLAVPALLVVGSYLGAISHALTAVAAARARGVALAGVVVSQSPASPVDLAETAATMARHVSHLKVVPLPRAPVSAWATQPDLTRL